MANALYVRPFLVSDGRVFLSPTTADTAEHIKAMPKEVHRVTLKKDRNWRLHAKYFALLRVVFNNQDQFASIDNLRDETLLAIGYSETRRRFNGEQYQIAKSMATGNITGDWTFEDIYKKSLDIWSQHFGFDPEDFTEYEEA